MLLGVYAGISSHGSPNFCGSRIPVPTNLDLREWASICHTEEDAVTLSYLTFVFPVGYEVLVPNPSLANHSSDRSHSRDIAAYIIKELREGAMLGPFDRPPLPPLDTNQSHPYQRPRKIPRPDAS